VVVSNRDDSSISILDATSLASLAVVPVAKQPEQLAILPDSSKVFVTSGTANLISAVDLKQKVLLANLSLGGAAGDLIMKPDGGELYVISPEANGLQAINTWTHEVADTMVLGSSPAFAIMNYDASEMYVADRTASRVIPVDILNRRMSAPPIAVGVSPFFMRFSPVERGAKSPMLLVVDESSGDLAVIRTRSDTLITLIPVGSRPQRLAVKTF